MAKTILLIEDDSAIIDVYKMAFEKAGFKIEVSTLGREAVEKLKRKGAEKPDLILLDLLLPDINGIEVLENIRKEKEIKDIPTFILTNYSDQELEKMGYDLKSEKHLVKTNYTPTELIDIVKKRLKEKK